MFITVEGLDGSGKTSVCKIIQEWLVAHNIQSILTREPGGMDISEQIRSIILDNKNKSMDAWTEALLYIASRNQHIVEVIQPALLNDKVVISDRFNDSTIAYQGFGRGLDIKILEKIQDLVLTNKIKVDLTLLLESDLQINTKRLNTRETKQNRLDQENIKFFQNVQKGYHFLKSKYPERFIIINTKQDLSLVKKDTIKILEKIFNK